MSPRRAFTLVETLVAAAIGVGLLGIMYQVVSLSRAASSTAHQSYVLSQDLASAFRMLQRELTETSLGSITFNGTLLTFVSAREEGGLKVDPSGAPHWLKAVYYKLTPAGDEVGTLIRRERDLPNLGTLFPGPVTLPLPGEAGRAVTHNLLLPGHVVTGLNGGRAEVKTDSTAPGGFTVSFVRRQGGLETLSAANPCSQTDYQQPGWTSGCTGLVEVQLGLLEKDGSTGQPGYLELRLRVKPAHP